MLVSPDSLNAAQRKEYDQAANTILCDCGCHPQAVHDCACGRAETMRSEIAGEIASGKTGQQVIEGYVARSGEKILVTPPAQGFNLVAWLGPGVLLVGAALGLTLVLKRWRGPGPVAPKAETPPPDEKWNRRLDEAMREYDR
jgi:cytochrome c-type biogenesis protein CcmH